MKVKTPPKIKTESLAELYQAGKTLDEIGAVFGLTRQAVQLRLKEAKIKRRPRGARLKHPAINREVLIELYLKQKLSPDEISQELALPASFVRSQLDKHKIPLRTMAETISVRMRRAPSVEELKKLYLEEEKSQAEIAGIYQTTQTKVFRWLKYHGLKKEIKPRSVKQREYRRRKLTAAPEK